MHTREARLGYRTWVEVDRSAIAHNVALFRARIPAQIKLLSVVKSNAYGHGLVDFSQEVAKLGVDWLAVDSIVEALRLREEGIVVPILVLGYTLPERMQEAIDHNISLTLSSLHALHGLKSLNLKGSLKIHIKVDSGMHRQGFMEIDLDEVITSLHEYREHILVEGLYTHLAAAKNPREPEATDAQVRVFQTWIQAIKKAGYKPIVHAAATGGALLFPSSHFDMVRIGIGFHGLWPSEESKIHLEKKMILKPTLSWKTIIAELKTLPAGSTIGYDFSEEVKRETKMAVCPIGYWHGFNRSLSVVGVVLVNGVRAKVLGRVSMDMIVIDVTDVPHVAVGDEVVLIGQSKEEYLGAAEVSRLAGVSTYEFLTRINPLIKKIYT